MKVRELRIGNYISGIYINEDSYEEDEELCKVVGIDSVGFSEYNIWVDGLEKSGIENYDSFEPIPITEEWLLKFGFFRTTDWLFYTDKFKIEKQSSKPIFWDFRFVTGTYSSVKITSIKHVHQLQNLYFSLTGEELTSK